MFDVLILKGQVVDGTGSAPYPADVGIMGDCIAAIGDLSGAKAKRVIDAAGKLVTPGFIDIHCHSDAVVFRPGKNPWRLQQGFTTEVVGNCGISAAPVNPDTLDQLKKYTSPFYAKMPVPYNWRSFGEYLDAVEENKPVLNTAALVGHGALRVATVGFANRVLTEPEMRQMETLLRESLRQGAFGMSTGLIYPPGTYADEAELTRLAKVLKAENALYTTHMRSESHQLEEAVEEALRLVENTGVSAEISHHKAAGRQNWGKLRHTIAAIEKANRQGHKVEYDVYPYTSGNTQLSAILPPWCFEGGIDKTMERLSAPSIRAKIIAEIKDESFTFENFFQLAGWDNILISECAVKAYENKTVQQIADEKGKDPFEMALDILLETKNAAMMIVFFMDEGDVTRALQGKYASVCTDGFPAVGRYHPRYNGACVRVLEQYVREKGLLSLEDAVHKMTGKPAAKVGLTDRGTLQVGKKADVVVMDFEALHDNADYDRHDATADGIHFVLLNGEMVVKEGRYTGIEAGRVLRKEPAV